MAKRSLRLMGIVLLCSALLLTGCAVVAPGAAPGSAAQSSPAPVEIVPPPAPFAGATLAWRTDLGGTVNWAPALLTGADGTQRLIVSSEAGSVVALAPTSGKILWQFTPPGQLWTDSVAVLGDAVFLANEGAEVSLLDGATGAVRWQTTIQPVAGEPLPGLEARSKPILVDGIIYVPSAGVGSRATVINPDLHAPLVALDFESGAESWRFDSANYILRAPFVEPERGTLFVGGNYLSEKDVDEGGALRIYALSRGTADVKWTFESHDGLIKSLWADRDVAVFVAYRDYVVGLDSRTGAEIYRHNSGNWVQSFAVFPGLPGRSAVPTLVYGSANAFLNVIDPRSGDFVWRYNVEGTFNYPMGNSTLDGETVYFISQRGDLHALDAKDGTLRWTKATGLESRDGIAAGGGYLFVGSVDGGVSGFRLE